MAVEPAVASVLGWDDGWQATWDRTVRDGWRPARVVTADRDTWLVAPLDDVSDPVAATISGRLRHETMTPGNLPAVGDWVAAASADDQRAVIHAVLERRSSVARSGADATRRGSGRLSDEQVLAANVDLVLIVAGLDRDFNLRRIERYLAVAWASGATPVLVLNKADTDDDLDGHRVAAEAIAPGVEVLAISALEGTGLDALQARIGARTSVVIGSSGVGKSTLVNRLLGHSRQTTAAVRADDDRGRHTTTRRELVILPGGGLLIDTPGLRALDVAGAADGIDAAFADVAELAARCRFRDCSHRAEPGCAVRAATVDGSLAVDRLESYRKLERELAFEARRTDPVATAEERRRWKIIHTSVRQAYRERYGREE